MTGIKAMKTRQVTCDTTAITPRSLITEKANVPTLIAMLVSITPWSVEACEKKMKDQLLSDIFQHLGHQGKNAHIVKYPV